MSRRFSVPGAALASATAVALFASALAAQAPAGVMLGTGFGFESYRFGDAAATGMTSLSLLTIPFGASIPLGPASLELGAAYARATLQRSDGSATTLAGPTDTQVGLSLPVGDVTLSAFGMIPTGVSKLTDPQADVAGRIAADLLPFRISNWGSGGGFGLGSTVAHRFAGTTLGGSAAYVVARQYDAVEGLAYRPGNELRLRAGLESRVGATGSLGLQLTMQKSALDQANGQNLFRPGTRLQALGSYSLALGPRSSGMLYGGVLHRSAGSFLTVSAPASSQDLVLAGGRLRIPLGRGVVEPMLDTRFFRSSDGLGQGWVAGAGLALQWPVGPTTLLIPTVRGRIGSYDVQAGQTSGFTGLDLGLTLRHGRSR